MNEGICRLLKPLNIRRSQADEELREGICERDWELISNLEMKRKNPTENVKIPHPVPASVCCAGEKEWRDETNLLKPGSKSLFIIKTITSISYGFLSTQYSCRIPPSYHLGQNHVYASS